MISIIADSGSTKTDWIILENAKVSQEFQSSGLNPYVHSSSEIIDVLNYAWKNFKVASSSLTTFFYGAGCSNNEMIRKMMDAFEESEFQGEINVSHDLLAAGRAVFKDEEGIICILGTGSSSSLYSKHQIEKAIPALGYVLGDEGGGVDLGKRLLVSIFKKDAPSKVIEKFNDAFEMDVNTMLNNVYFEKNPNKFIASFATFIADNLHEDYLKTLVYDSFTNFIELNILKYKEAKELPIAFIGSVSFHFQDILRQALMDNNLKVAEILKSPKQKLIEYHKIFSS